MGRLMRKLSGLIIMLILLVGMHNMAGKPYFMNSTTSTNNKILTSPSLNSATVESPKTITMSHIEDLSETETKVLDMNKLISYTERLMGDFGEFPLANTEDGYANATFFGIESLYLTGKMETVAKSDKIVKYLDLLYNDSNGGFRSWLGGNVTLRDTAYGILIMNTTRVSFDAFNVNLTTQLIENNTVNGGIQELYNDHADLFTTSLAALALYLINQSKSFSQYIDFILSYYSTDNGFYDGTINIPIILQNYFALKALFVIDKDRINETIKQSLIDLILNRFRYRGNESTMIGGFGSIANTPTVFETGLCLEMLAILGYDNETLMLQCVSFVNNSQGSNGEIFMNPNVETADIFQVYGALTTYLIARKFVKFIDIQHSIIPSEQVPIDYDNMQFRLKFLISDNDLDYLNVTYEVLPTHFKRNFTFDGIEAYYANIYPGILGFGNFTAFVHAYPGLIGYPKRAIDYRFNFRVGYHIALRLNVTTIAPGQVLSMEVNVTYGNGTFINEGKLILNVSKGDFVIFQNESNLAGAPITITWDISDNISLGTYIITAVVNDSHGTNHTYTVSEIMIHDELDITLETELEEEYIIGAFISNTLSVRYDTTATLIPTTPNVTAFIGTENYTYANYNLTWISDGKLNFSIKLPQEIPLERNLSVVINFNWDNEIVQKYTLANINISLGTLNVVYTLELETEYFYGDELNVKTKITVEETNVEISNATLYMSIVNITEGENISYQLIKGVYNDTTHEYEFSDELNPNIPQGNYQVIMRLYIPFNDSYVSLGKDLEIQITVKGQLEIDKLFIRGNKVVEETVSVAFTVICKENNKNVSGLLSVANITNKKYEESIIPLETSKGLYEFVMIFHKAGTYNVSIYRVEDKAFIGSFEIKISPKTEEVIEWFNLYGPIITVTIVIALAITYIILSWWFGKKISRRYLIRKLRKK